jgi:hypothetical protein
LLRYEIELADQANGTAEIIPVAFNATSFITQQYSIGSILTVCAGHVYYLLHLHGSGKLGRRFGS